MRAGGSGAHPTSLHFLDRGHARMTRRHEASFELGLASDLGVTRGFRLSCKRMAATSALLLPSAQRQMLPKGTINALPSFVSEYWTAIGLPSYTCRLIRPVDSRFRKVRVSMRCEMFRNLRRNCPWRCGPLFSAYMIFTVHLPTKIVGTRFEPSPVFSIRPSINCILLLRTQAGTRVYLLDGT